MTDQETALRELLAKGTDASVLREMIGFTAQRLMELEIGGLTGAAHGERSPDRLTQRRYYDVPSGIAAVTLGAEHGAAANN